MSTKNCIAIALLAFVAFASAQTAPDIHDSICVAYRLNAVEEAQFDPADGLMAAFWGEWDTQNASSLTLDYILMDPDHNAQPGRDYYSGPEDNSLYVKAAYGDSGIYLLIEMVDDDFIDRGATNDDSLHQDIIELYLDTLSAQEIIDGGAGVLVGLYSSTLTYTTLQFAMSVGGTQTYDNFRISYYNNNLWSWQDQWVTWAQNATLHGGMRFDHFAVDGTRKAQEWYIPWSWAGNEGIPNPVPAEGKRFAFAGGCHDMDMARVDTVCSLKWKNRANPWAEGDNWGDIEMGVPLTTVAVAERPVPVGSAVGSLEPVQQVFGIDGRLLGTARTAGLRGAAGVVVTKGTGRAAKGRLGVVSE